MSTRHVSAVIAGNGWGFESAKRDTASRVVSKSAAVFGMSVRRWVLGNG
jgi:hypothetical protein